MISIRDLIESARAELPAARFARWASALFTFSVLSLLVSLSASQAFLFAAAVSYAFHLLRDQPTGKDRCKTHPYMFPPVKLALALYCLFSILPVFWAFNPGAGWFALRKLFLFLIWLLAINLVVSAGHLNRLFKILFVVSAGAGLVATGQFVSQYRAVRALHPSQAYFYMTTERIHGFMGHWMNFGGQQMLIFAALMSYLLLAPRATGSFNQAPGEQGKTAPAEGGPRGGCRGKIWWVILAVVAVSIVLNFTRGVWLGCLVAVVYLVGRRKLRWLLALPVLLVAGYLAAPTLVRQRVKVLLHPTSDPSISIRLEMWQVALRMIREHPFVGVGPNNIEHVYPLYLPFGTAPRMGYHQHLHNNFLQLAAERGLPCLAAWLWLMGALAWHFARIRRQLIRDRRPTWVADAAMAAWLAFLAEGFFEFNFGTSPVLMLFLFVTSTPFVVEKQARSQESEVRSQNA